MRLYLDSAPIIYFVEATPLFAEAVERKMGEAGVEVVSCELACLECLVKPLRDEDAALGEDFEDFFANSLAELAAVSLVILRSGARLRAAHAFLRTPDAIHLAAAIEMGCDRFLTNDQRLGRFTGIDVEILAT